MQEIYNASSAQFDGATNEELATELNDAENSKLFMAGVTVINISAFITAATIGSLQDAESVKTAMLLAGAATIAATYFSAIRSLEANERAGAIIETAQQRGLNVIPGPHRTIEIQD